METLIHYGNAILCKSFVSSCCWIVLAEWGMAILDPSEKKWAKKVGKSLLYHCLIGSIWEVPHYMHLSSPREWMFSGIKTNLSCLTHWEFGIKSPAVIHSMYNTWEHEGTSQNLEKLSHFIKYKVNNDMVPNTCRYLKVLYRAVEVKRGSTVLHHKNGI